ncbi:MAG: hypothetical protein ACYC2R_03935 [Burkholderiales bacterium]
MATKNIYWASAVALCISSPAWATGTSANTPLGNAATPAAGAQHMAARPHANQFGASGVCKSGSRTVSYDWNAASGALKLDVVFADCQLANGATVNGTDATDGTLTASGSSGYKIDLSDTVDTTVTDKFGNSHTRNCTITRTGTLDTSTKVFSGTVTRNNCTLSGDFREGLGLIEMLANQPTNDEQTDVPNAGS